MVDPEGPVSRPHSELRGSLLQESKDAAPASAEIDKAKKYPNDAAMCGMMMKPIDFKQCTAVRFQQCPDRCAEGSALKASTEEQPSEQTEDQPIEQTKVDIDAPAGVDIAGEKVEDIADVDT